MKIVVVGLGYVGLSNAVLLSQKNEVIGVDVSKERVDLLNSRLSPIKDAEITQYLRDKDLNLFGTTELHESLHKADYVIVSTPTNYNETTNFFDTSSVEAVISETLKIAPNVCVVVKSTVPIGFIDKMRERFKTDSILFSPEFLREGKALHDNLFPSRIIIGDCSQRAKIFADLLQKSALKDDVTVLFTGTREAEAIKLFSNTYLAMRVAYFNELDSYALFNDMNSKEIIKGVGLDQRIGNYYNNPSFGYGGYCLPKDTKQLLASYAFVPQNIIAAIIEANSTRKDFISAAIIKMKPNTVGVYRLAMKKESDNFRESSMIGIIERLKFHGVKLIIYEPEVNEEMLFELPIIKSLNEFKQLSDVIVANRVTDELSDSAGKVFTRDLFHEN